MKDFWLAVCLAPLFLWLISAGIFELYFYAKGKFVERLVKTQRGDQDADC